MNELGLLIGPHKGEMKLRVEVDRCKSEELCVLDVDRDLLGNVARVVGPEPDIPGVILDGP